ncbi:MAG: DUF4913 domain-containing protein [Acidimicrobiales bacterium]
MSGGDIQQLPLPGGDPIASQLLQHAKALAELRRDLSRLAHETTDTFIDISRRLDEADDANDEDSRNGQVQPWCWRNLGPTAQAELRQQLGDWISWLRSRYPLARRIPNCWDQHPEIIEELTALWLAWQAAYTEPDPPLTAPADWHDRWLPGLLRRLEHGPFALDCRESHNARPSSAYTAVPDEKNEVSRSTSPR